MPLQATSGAASYDAFGGGVAAVPKYIEDYFSTFLYSGAGTTQTINNGVDLSGKGGLVWLKDRGNAGSHRLVDTVRGNRSTLFSDSTSAAVTRSNDVSCDVSSFNSNGFTAGNFMNQASNNYVSWSWAKAPKFFDVVTYTGNGVAGRNIPHALNSVPGFVIVKRTDTTGEWRVLHRNDGTNWLTGRLISSALDTSPSPVTFGNDVVFIAPTSTQFTVGSFADVNESGGTYVAYLFAHDAGGFGLSGTDNVISCGSFTTDASSNATVNLGYEPQWVLIKNSQAAANWVLIDNMRGWANSSAADPKLNPNNSDSEDTTGQNCGHPTATGFTVSQFAASNTHIYIAIRRGPMKVPTSGTSVFSPVANSTNIATTNFPVDFNITQNRSSGFTTVFDRLRGGGVYSRTSSTAAEVDAASGGYSANFASNTQFDNSAFWASASTASWNWKRAPSFFDEVCYTGNSTAGLVVNHNLAVVPELVIFKKRAGSTGGWPVWTTSVGTGTSFNYLNTTSAVANQGVQIFTATPTSSAMTLGSWTGVNDSNTMVAYLFATCEGVSKVGSYTGTGATQIIDCGFTGGARFVLIKCINAAGAWYVWDSARGMVFGTDPYLLLNSTAAEFSNLPTGTYTQVTSETGGFGLSAAEGNVNINSYSYIFLAIA